MLRKQTLGQSDLNVSIFCLGTMYFGTKIDAAQSFRLLDFFCDAGGNFIDTSNNYAFWMEGAKGDESEKVIGQWLRKNGQRDKIILASKCGARPTKYEGNLESIELEGLRYDTIIQSVENSLRRLQSDYLDLLYAHIDFLEYPIEERLKAFTLLKEQGKIREIGTSNTEAWRIEESQAQSRQQGYLTYCCAQQKYTYLRPRREVDFWKQKLLTEEMIQYAAVKKEITLLAYATLLSGFYAQQNPSLPPEYDSADNRQRLATLQQIAQQKSCTPNQLVLAWIRQHEPAIIPVISGSKTEQLAESMAATEVNLSTEEWKRLEEAGE